MRPPGSKTTAVAVFVSNCLKMSLGEKMDIM